MSGVICDGGAAVATLWLGNSSTDQETGSRPGGGRVEDAKTCFWSNKGG